MGAWRKRGAGERVLESKHVIGLFLLMLLFSGVFFTLGYVMGRNQYNGQVSAGSGSPGRVEPVVMAKPETASRKNTQPPETETESDPAVSTPPGWNFSEASKPAKVEPRLEPAPKASVSVSPAKTVNAKAKVTPPAVAAAPVKSTKSSASAPLIPAGALVLQVAALVKQDDALSIASGLQKKHYLAYVQTPVKDKYYRVQVGPFKDQKAADAAKKGLESEGFKAFYVKH